MPSLLSASFELPYHPLAPVIFVAMSDHLCLMDGVVWFLLVSLLFPFFFDWFLKERAALLLYIFSS